MIKVKNGRDSTTILFSKDENGNIIGHKIDVRIFKTKNHSYDKSVPYSVNFYNDGGFNPIDEYARIFIETEIVKLLKEPLVSS